MDEKEYYARHLRNMRRNSRRVRALLEKSYTELGREIASHKFINPARFTWAQNKKLGDRVDIILGKQSIRLESEISRSVISEWMLASQKNDELARAYIKNIYISNKIRKEIFQTNTEALNAFIARTDTNQFNLSKRVWRLTNETKSQLKFHISQGIATGKDAAEISRDVRNILVEPNRLYRRVRDETGKLVLSRPAKAYKPGAGVYRSSYKNALRLAATETNMAYRASDYMRRKQLPFVAGYKVNLSGQHKVYDICDEMKGSYPKEFKFVGWHPHCLCYTTSILMKEDKFIKYLKTGKIDKKLYVDKIPIKAERYVNKNVSKIAKMKNKPYWTENFNKDLKLKSSIGKSRRLVELQYANAKDYERIKKLPYYNNLVAWQKPEAFTKGVLNKKRLDLLNETERVSIFRYTGGEDINLYIQDLVDGKIVRNVTNDSFIKVLQDALNKLDETTGIVHRGTSLPKDYFKSKYKIGNTIQEKRFWSSSFDRSFAKGWANSCQSSMTRKYPSKEFIEVLFEINSKSGINLNGLTLMKEESEVLFNSNTIFKVLKIEYDKYGVALVKLEEVVK